MRMGAQEGGENQPAPPSAGQAPRLTQPLGFRSSSSPLIVDRRRAYDSLWADDHGRQNESQGDKNARHKKSGSRAVILE